MELIGQRFGHIRVTEVVGQGGMGDVYAGYDEKLERRVAVKVLNTDQRLDQEARDRLLREARALSRLDHPNICRIHDYIESGDVDLLVLEFIDGTTLDHALAQDLSRGEKLRIASAIAGVLVAAHRAGIVHRDLKPENVMLTKTGEVKVLDFGLARWLHRARTISIRRNSGVLQVLPVRAGDTLRLPGSYDSSAPQETAAGITLGTPLYMSPEQARGETLTPASDMFSFGLLLQALFTGNDPHPAGLTSREVILRVARGETNPVNGLAHDVGALIQRLKEFAPADRPTAVEAVERLRFMADKPQRYARRAFVAVLVLIASLAAWRYTADLQRERTKAVKAEAEAKVNRAKAEELIEFMLGDLREKLEPVGRVDVLNDVAERALAYSAALDPEQLTPDELLRNAKALHQLVQVRIAQGNLDGALDAANRASRFTDAAAKRTPASPGVRFGVGTSHFWIANVHRLRSELPKALEHAEAYRAVTAGLAIAHPANREYQIERDYGQAAVATILELQGDLARAAEVYERSVEQRRKRVAGAPADAGERAQLAVALNKLGFVRQRLGALGEARRCFEEEYSIYRALTAADPGQHKMRERLAVSESYLSGLLEIIGEDARALDHRIAEVGIGRDLHAHDPANAAWQRNLAISLMRLGELRRRRGDGPAAETLIEEAGALMEDLLRRADARKSWKKDLAVVRIAHARLLLEEKRPARAVTVARHAGRELEPFGSDPQAQRHQAEAALTFGEALSVTGDARGASEQWMRATRILEPHARTSSDPLLLDIWARSLLRVGRGEEAAGVLRRLDQAGYHSRDLDQVRSRRIG